MLAEPVRDRACRKSANQRSNPDDDEEKPNLASLQPEAVLQPGAQVRKEANESGRHQKRRRDSGNSLSGFEYDADVVEAAGYPCRKAVFDQVPVFGQQKQN